MQRATVYIGNKCFDAPALNATDLMQPTWRPDHFCGRSGGIGALRASAGLGEVIDPIYDDH
jgi:hypothetical protein